MDIAALGILAGWRRRRTAQCEVLTMQLIEGVGSHATTKVVVALSDEQLCSLTRDLSRAAASRGLEVWPNGGAPSGRSLLDRLIDKALGRAPRGQREPGRRPAILALPAVASVMPAVIAEETSRG